MGEKYYKFFEFYGTYLDKYFKTGWSKFSKKLKKIYGRNRNVILGIFRKRRKCRKIRNVPKSELGKFEKLYIWINYKFSDKIFELVEKIFTKIYENLKK